MKLPKPSRVTLSQVEKIVKAAAYVGVSAFLGAVIAAVQNQPELFGVYAPLVNIVLVTLKQVFTQE